MEKEPIYMQNREISWLRFNDRVLAEASQDDVAAFEKLKFISIFNSNLDEFFMVRVGSLKYLTLLKKPNIDSKTGMTAQEQIDAILEMLPKMYQRKDRLFVDVMKELEQYNIHEYDYHELGEGNQKEVKRFYKESIKPTIFAQIIDKQHPFPFLENSLLYIFVELEKDGKKNFGIIEIPDAIRDFLLFQGDGIDFILTEKIVYEFADDLFEGYEVKSKAIIRVMRNFDFNETAQVYDEFDDYKDKMKMIIKKRKRQSVVRLDSNQKLPNHILNYLTEELEIPKKAYFYSESPLKMRYVFDLLSVIPSAKQEKILYPKFTPYYVNRSEKISMIERIEKKDLLLSYPYDDMQTYIDLLSEAAEDERVLSIKITIYRLAKYSKVVEALCKAAENGKDVTVCIELKARFDEENNINYTDTLDQAGCKIIYGFEQYKVHSKLCLITYKDPLGGCKFITQIGTGNYNESTAKIYADLSFMTANREIGLDASDFFNNMSIGNLNGKYEHLVQSPSSLKDKFLKLIDREIEKGSEGFLFFKMNSFTDKNFIEKLSEASQNNVKVIMIIRGICCLLPGVPGATENIEVRSIVGRFLEHARVFQFGKGDNADVYIGSADLMTRNTEQRVEIACPIYDLDIKREIEAYIRIQLHDNIKGRKMNSSGEYEPVLNNSESLSSQDYFLEKAKEKLVAEVDNDNTPEETMDNLEGSPDGSHLANIANNPPYEGRFKNFIDRLFGNGNDK